MTHEKGGADLLSSPPLLFSHKKTAASDTRIEGGGHQEAVRVQRGRSLLLTFGSASVKAMAELTSSRNETQLFWCTEARKMIVPSTAKRHEIASGAERLPGVVKGVTMSYRVLGVQFEKTIHNFSIYTKQKPFCEMVAVCFCFMIEVSPQSFVFPGS